MSQTEFHTGKLYKVQIEDTLEQTCRKIAKEHNIELDDDWKENFIDQFDNYSKKRGHIKEEYFVHKENLYKVINHQETDNDEYFMNLSKNDDGSISFIGQFYNGGTCFSEMLEEALENLTN
jgi:hypothetical protein